MALYTIDELTGFVAACVMVRPTRSIKDLTVKSVRKKWKERSFAAGVEHQVNKAHRCWVWIWMR